MSRFSVFTVVFAAMAVPALAHPGHLAAGNGSHTHWLALGAVTLAVIVAIAAGVVTLSKRSRIARNRSGAR